MDFEDKLNTYANLIVSQGMNVQPGQDVYIGSEIFHKDFVNRIVRASYQRGARVVHVEFHDPRNLKIRIEESKDDKYLSFVPPCVPFRFESMVPEMSACVRIIGSEYPDILSDLPPKKVNEVEINFRRSLKKYYEEAIGQSKVQWCVVAAATPKWGKNVFPELDEEKAYAALWDEIFRICRADRENCMELWQTHNEVLTKRAHKLNSLKIKNLHFTGPGTDLYVGLSPYAVFQGGTKPSARGHLFEANLPTEECFTGPDFRMTEGVVSTTRPFLISGKQIRGLKIVFKKGEIVDFHADSGEETFREYIATDPGAKRLGEVALVGIDSPIYQSGRVFEEILFDENAACHIAIGFAYRSSVQKEIPEGLDSIGFNVSAIHTDMMISSNEVSVEAECYSGKVVPLLENGAWV